MRVLRTLAHQEAARQAAPLGDSDLRQHVNMATPAPGPAETIEPQPSPYRQRLQTGVGAAHAYPHPARKFALRDPGLVLKQIEDLANERFALGQQGT